MNAAVIQLLVLAGVALFLILRLRSVLGTREGFEKPPLERPAPEAQRRPDFEVIEGGPDPDIVDHVPEGSPAAAALARMKAAEPSFHVGEFLEGAKQAYEMILMAFENGDLAPVRGFLSEDVAAAFQEVIDQRADQGLRVDATFVGLREIAVNDAEWDEAGGVGEITLRLVGELTSVVRDLEGEVVEGDPNTIAPQRDIWTFARRMGADDPNWQLVATGG
ncbi:putative lipid-binding transport protein (Tim44 family) [Hasllibacter halocynthiae]|uniref:Putative lipid-binding transport protein (Tim44 family) n=1 Tax=Hasllibacter halocynthiae TaxID=595589 RepID=A0A2T0X2L2_9RHOB|nr:Tim44/TimA family putative adaptor protein [Hasllibacter halocynthiae]PRY93135.1 putative lipid-binding transport protein (Tim44 family) [Hasllibacter halocynthiae]